MKKRHLLSIVGTLSLLLCFSAGAQTVNLSQSGLLTRGYSWAYGTWHITESVPDGGDGYDFYINIGNRQVRMKDKSLSDIPILAIPEANYTINEMDADMFDLGPDEILLEFVGRYGEDTFLILDRKNKTLSHFNENDRNERGIRATMEKVEAGTPGEAYLEALASAPIIGTWQDTDDPALTKTFTRETVLAEFIPAAGGAWEHYLKGMVYSYNPASGLLTARNPFDTEGRHVKTYRKAN